MTSKSNAPWPAEDEEVLRHLWLGRQHSASDISKLGINGRTYTRNAIIAKVHRLKLVGGSGDVAKGRRSSPQRAMPAKRTKVADDRRERKVRAVPVLAPDNYVPIADDVIPLHQRRTVETIERGECRWPIGDPGQPGFHFCGGRQIPGQPYCYDHTRRAHQVYVVADRTTWAGDGQTGVDAGTGSWHRDEAAHAANLEDLGA